MCVLPSRCLINMIPVTYMTYYQYPQDILTHRAPGISQQKAGIFYLTSNLIVVHTCIIFVVLSLPVQGRIFRIIWLPSLTKKLVLNRKLAKNCHVFGLKSGQRQDLDSACPKTPVTFLMFDHIDGFDFWVYIASCLPLLQEGTTAKFPAIDRSHNGPCASPNICVAIIMFTISVTFFPIPRAWFSTFHPNMSIWCSPISTIQTSIKRWPPEYWCCIQIKALNCLPSFLIKQCTSVALCSVWHEYVVTAALHCYICVHTLCHTVFERRGASVF